VVLALSSPWAARAVSGTVVVIDFTGLGTFTTSSLAQGNLVVQGSADVNVLNLNGIGVVGGVFSDTLDGDEYLDFSFNAGCFVQVSYSVSSSGNLNGNGTSGDAQVEAFGCSDLSLGSVMVSGGGDIDLSALFPGQRISRFRVTADGDNQRISQVTYVLGVVDVDGDGEVEALTDSLLLLRYAFGFRGATLVTGAVDLGHCTRCTAPQIENYVATLQ
jgi:hypothetical protein